MVIKRRSPLKKGEANAIPSVNGIGFRSSLKYKKTGNKITARVKMKPSTKNVKLICADNAIQVAATVILLILS
ncbi:hypothetical protein [Bacillus sp. JJ1764]|uniref:hypothetical protein n=1 Tax=Bacillus sp. JJ1764 TaxID=3122964 RepID=UPI002FFE4D86